MDDELQHSVFPHCQRKKCGDAKEIINQFCKDVGLVLSHTFSRHHGGSVKLEFVNFMPLEQCLHKPMGNVGDHLTFQ